MLDFVVYILASIVTMENQFNDEIADIDTGMMVKDPMQVKFQQMIIMS